MVKKNSMAYDFPHNVTLEMAKEIVTYVSGYLHKRTGENCLLDSTYPVSHRALNGIEQHDGCHDFGGLISLYENGKVTLIDFSLKRDQEGLEKVFSGIRFFELFQDTNQKLTENQVRLLNETRAGIEKYFQSEK